MVSEIYIIRHGETDYNKKGIIQGKGIDAPINETGEAQALAFFKKYENLKFDSIRVSTLQRTYQTLLPFINLGIEYHKKPELDEISWGIYEGQESGTTAHSELMEVMQSWKNKQMHVKAPNGESPIDVTIRQESFIEELYKEDYERILVCSHGRAMRILLCNLIGLNLWDMENFRHHNTCLYILKANKENKQYEIVKANCTQHYDLMNIKAL